jgi:hypothetical protein
MSYIGSNDGMIMIMINVRGHEMKQLWLPLIYDHDICLRKTTKTSARMACPRD